jgi:tRNA G10  N-methylase Trm11
MLSGLGLRQFYKKRELKVKNKVMIKTTSYSQEEIIKSIIKLHCNQGIELDATYSKGNFYKKTSIDEPLEKFDLYPQTDDTLEANANDLPHLDCSISSIMFDPPFLVGYTKDKPTGIMGNRFHGFRNIAELWQWYSECIVEFYRVLEKNGVLIFKCQDTVSSGKQHFSHVHIINEATKAGFYTKDLFVLISKNRIIGHNHGNQKHARKFHSYFLVFEKQ